MRGFRELGHIFGHLLPWARNLNDPRDPESNTQAVFGHVATLFFENLDELSVTWISSFRELGYIFGYLVRGGSRSLNDLPKGTPKEPTVEGTSKGFHTWTSVFRKLG